MDALSFIAKSLGAPARFGASVAIGAIVLYALRRFETEPFASADPTVVSAILIAGTIGGAAVVVETLISTWSFAKWLVSALSARRAARAEQEQKRTIALKNMRCMTIEFCDVFLFLKSRNARRYPADADNRILSLMQHALLL